MVLKLRNKHLTTQVNFSKDNDVQIDINQDNPLRRITLNFFFEIIGGTSQGTVAIQDDLLNVIKRMQVIFNGATNKFDVDLRTYYRANTFQNGTTAFRDAFVVPTASGTTTFRIAVTIDFAQLKNNLTDFSGLFNAPAFSSLNLKIQWGSIADVLEVPNDTTIGSNTRCEIAITEVYDNGQGENQLSQVVLASQDIREGVDVTNITQAFDSFGGSELEAKILPVPSTILEHCLVALDNVTDGQSTRSNTVINQLKLENVRGGEELIFFDEWINYFEQNKAEYGLESDVHVTGALFISWNELRIEGLLNNVVDALKYKFLTSQPDNTKSNAVRIYKKYIVITNPTSTA